MVPVVARLCRAVDAGLSSIDLSLVIAAAERAATAVLAGGRLFVTGSADFVSEAVVRGGGLMIAEPLADCECGSGDVVLVGWTLEAGTADERSVLGALLRKVSNSCTCTIAIGPAEAVDALPSSESVDTFYHLPSQAPRREDVADFLVGGHPYALHSLQNISLLWVFTAEFTAALTREGAMPVFYQSVLVEGARERNAAREAASIARSIAVSTQVEQNGGPARVEASHAVPPQPAGVLGARYLTELRARVAALGDKAAEPIGQAAAVCARARARGNTIYTYLIGHFPVHQTGRPGDPGVLTVLEDGRHGELPSEDELRTKVERGDIFCHIGYYRRPRACYEVCRNAGVEAIIESIPDNGEEMDELSKDTGMVTKVAPMDGWHADPPDVVIRPGFPIGDAVLPVDGYDVEICPVSALLQALVFWALSGSIRCLELPEGERSRGCILHQCL